MGHRQVAAHLGRAEGTVRGWIRRFRRRPEEVRRYFTVALVALADDPVMPVPSGTAFEEATAACSAGSRRPAATNCGPWTPCADRTSAAARRWGLRPRPRAESPRRIP
ncbi:hypothetical protein [Streptomyces sp. MBT62]|uniref:hypothetical protein n=1 Tax=Streptomyces sp. MBT62 TaxID=2800410 RepID=UPI0035ABE9A4